MSSSAPRTLPTEVVLFGCLLAAAVALAGCGCAGGCGGGTHPNLPDWYLNTPEDPNYVYATATADDEQMQVAIDTAMAKTRTDLAAHLDVKLKSYTHAFADTLDGRLGRQLAATRQRTARTLAEEAVPTKKEVYKEDGTWRAFVLIEMPVTEVAQELLTGLEKHEELYTRFRESSSYQEVTEAAKETKERSQER